MGRGVGQDTPQRTHSSDLLPSARCHSEESVSGVRISMSWPALADCIHLTVSKPSTQSHNYFPQNCVFTSLGRKLGKVGSWPHLLLLILPQEQKHKVVNMVWHHHHCQSIMIHNQGISNKSWSEVPLGLHSP